MGTVLRRDRGLIALLALFVLVAPLVTHRIYASDEIQYFSYTHSLFFDHDLNFTNQYQHFCTADPVKFADFCRDLLGKREPATGLPINVAPIGTGLFWLPSFALAHVLVLLARAFGSHVAADGFSDPYIFAITTTSYIYGCIGLLFCYALSRRIFDQLDSTVAVVASWLATPVIFYTVIAPPWSHATSLMTVSLFLWYWYRTRGLEGRTWRQWVLLGFLGGLVMLIREQDALFLAVPGLEALVAVAGILRGRLPVSLLTPGSRQIEAAPRPQPVFIGGESKTQQLVSWIGGVALMGIVAAVVFIPQVITYVVITGHMGPSKVVSSKFNWLSPNFLNVLFSPEHGLVPWTPFFAVALLGLVLLWRRDRLLTGVLLISFLMQVYIAGSFLTWQSASSFGQRRFINSTAIFVLGFAALGAWLLAHGVPKWAYGALAAVFIAWNAGLLMQYALWCSPQRQGLDWATVIKGQIEMPGKAFGLLRDYLFNRSVFYRRTKGC